MKIKLNPLKRGKKVYYYEHQNGVLKGKQGTTVRAFTNFLVAIFIVGGAGALSAQVLEQVQSSKAQTALQRQTTPVNTVPATTENTELKNANLKAREDEQLAKQVKEQLKNIPGGKKWSVYVRDVKSDRMASINADEKMDAAGLSNLFLTIPLEEKTEASKWGSKYGQTTLADCVTALLSTKDPNCLKTVRGAADVKEAGNHIAAQGFKKTEYTDKNQTTTARDMGELMFRLHVGEVLSDKARRVVFDGLYSQKMREGLPAGCKDQCLVANISGEAKGVRHDAAIVTDGDAQYVVVVMSEEATWSQMAGFAADLRQVMKP